MTYFLPGSKRHNLVTSSDVLNSRAVLEKGLHHQEQELVFHTSYFKFCEYIFGILCLWSAAIFNLWNLFEGKIVNNFTSAFRDKVLTDVTTKKEGQDNANNARKRHIEYFKKFFIQYKHFKSYALKYVSIYGMAMVTQIGYIVLMASILFDNWVDMFKTEAYKNIIKLSFQDDLLQLRTDRLAIIFPTFFSCLVPFTGPSGSTFNATVTCTSMTNNLTSKIHVLSLIFCWFMLLALMMDLFWFTWSLASLPYAKSQGNKHIRKYLSQFSIGKRILFMLFEKNCDALFWDEMLQELFAEDKKMDSNESDLNVKIEKQCQKRRQKVKNEDISVDLEFVPL